MKNDFFKKILYLTIMFSILFNHASSLIAWALQNTGDANRTITNIVEYSTNSLESMQNVINNLEEGDKLVLKEGTYEINEQIRIDKSNITIEGEKDKNVVILSNNSSLDSVFSIETNSERKNNLKNIEIKNISINGSGCDKGISVVRRNEKYEIKDISIIGCHIYNVSEACVFLNGKTVQTNNPIEGGNQSSREYTKRFTIDNILIQDCVFENSSIGISQNICSKTKIINNYINANRQNITINVSDFCTCAGNTLNVENAENEGLNSIEINESYGSIIKDNFINNTNSNNIGICINPTSGISENITIENNTILGSVYGICLENNAGKDIHIYNNIIKECKNNGIRIKSLNGNTDLVNNVVKKAEGNYYNDYSIDESNYANNYIWNLNVEYIIDERETTVNIRSNKRKLGEIDYWTLSENGYSISTKYYSSDQIYSHTSVDENVIIKDENKNEYNLKLSSEKYIGNIESGYSPIIGTTKNGKTLRMGYTDFNVNETGEYELRNTRYYLADESKEKCIGDNIYMFLDNIEDDDIIEIRLNTEKYSDGEFFKLVLQKNDNNKFEILNTGYQYPSAKKYLKDAFICSTQEVGNKYKVTIRFNRYFLTRSTNEFNVFCKITKSNESNIDLIFENSNEDNISTWGKVRLTELFIVDKKDNIIQDLIKNKQDIENTSAPKSNVGEKEIDLMIFMGQSNMVGYGHIEMETEESINPILGNDGHSINKGFKIYKEVDGKKADITNDEEKLVDIGEPFGKEQNYLSDGSKTQNAPSGSMVTALTNAYYKKTGIPVVAISSAVGGQSIYEWWNSENNKDYGLQDAKIKYEEAVKYLINNGYTIRNKYMIWCQGESDTGTQSIVPKETPNRYDEYLKEGNSYEDKLKNVINEMSNIEVNVQNNTYFGIDKAFIIKVGHKAGSYAMHDDIMKIQEKICEENENIILASNAYEALSLCKENIWNDDNSRYEYKYMNKNDLIHFHQEAYNLLGYDAGKNIAYYTNTQQKPILTGYEVDRTKNELVKKEKKIELDEEFFNSNDLGIGLFFSTKYTEEKPTGDVNKEIGLYVTNNGKDYTYIAETGITGRDPNIMYKNGVFYMTTTKGGDDSGRVVVNIFKSTDLINWTNIQDEISRDEAGDTQYRYSLGTVKNNFNNITTNTWSPKWFKDGEKTYILVSTQRFTVDGEALSYFKSDCQTLINNGLVKDENEYNNLGINSNINGVLVKEIAKKDEQGNIIYEVDSKGKKTNKVDTDKSFYLNNGQIVQNTVPFDTDGKYALFDTYIAEVTGLGNEEQQKDINIKNLVFGELKKVKFISFDEMNEYGEEVTDIAPTDDYLKHSMLGIYLIKNDNENNKYAMYTKTDPYGTVQRWVSNNIYGPYTQADERFYISNNFNDSINTDGIQCISTESYNNDLVFKKHFEGAFIGNFGDETLFYSDHYITNQTEEVGSTDGDYYLENRNKVAGIYYSVLEKNNNDVTDFGITNHIRFNAFNKVNLLNTNMRPTSSRENQIRNGTVLTIKSEEDKESIRNIIKNASNFNTTVKKYKQSNNKYTIVVKSNRAISNKDENGNDTSWYLDGWKYVSEMKNDSNVESYINNIYNYYMDKYVPYYKSELYIYKTFDRDIDITVELTDFNYDTKTVEIESEKQSITITDEKLYSAIIEQLEISEDTIVFEKKDESKTINISENELQKVKKLQLNNLNLKDITGLEGFKFVEELNISNNNITSINSLSQLTTLRKLEAFGNTISDISPISNITTLEYLDISKNNLKDSDSNNTVASEISNLVNLTYLDMSHNYIKYTSGLNTLTNLEELNLYDNMIVNLNGLSTLTKLISLNLGQNNEFQTNLSGTYNIANIATLNNLINLKKLDFSQNNIPYVVNYINSLQQIEYLNLESNQIATITGKGFENFTNLKEINLYNNNITDISSLYSIANLEKVIVQKNNIVSLEGILDEHNELVWKSNNLYLDIAFNNIDNDLQINRNILNILCNKSNDKILALNYENITNTSELPHSDSNGIKYVTYEDFGARCDGVYDDFIAIRNAHIFANENNCEVRGNENKEYHIFKYYEDPVEIDTNVNWNNSKIIIHDEEIENHSGRYKDIFKINNMKDSVKIDNPGWTINRTTKKIDISNLNISGYQKYYCIATNNEKKQFIRAGSNANSGNYQQDYFTIDNEGNLLNDVQWDFDKLTSIEFYGIPDSEIFIQNVNIITNSLISQSEASYRKNNSKDEYFARGIYLNYASNVKISGIKHTLSNDELSGSYRGIIRAWYGANLEITDCNLFTRKYSITDRSTYDLNLYAIVNGKIKNVASNNIGDEQRWGITGTNYSKDIVFENCTLNRIDAHAGIYNLDIINCTVGCKGLTLTGQGDLNIVGTTVTSKAFLILRTDYGATWDGNVNIKDCIFKFNQSSKEPKLVQIDFLFDDNNYENLHDFGYQCKFPNIYAEDLKIDISACNRYEDVVIIPVYTEAKLKNVPESYWPEKIFINGYEFINIDGKKPYIKFFGTYPFNFENVNENYCITDAKLKLNNIDGEDITRKFNLNEELKTSDNIYFEINKNASANNYLSLKKDNQSIIEDVLIENLYNYTFKESGKYQIKIESKPIIYSKNQDGTISENEDDKISGEKIYEFEIKNDVIISGDINGDGKLDVSDLLLIKRHLIAGSKEEWKLSEKQQKYADIDNNGVVDVSDLLYLKRKLLNIY